MPRIGLTPDELLVNNTVDHLKLLGVKGRRATNPATRSECTVIKAVDGAVAERAGFTTWNERGYLILCMSAELRRRGARFIHSRTVDRVLESLETAFPVLVTHAKQTVGLEQITRVLRNLASEEFSVRNLRAILERMLEFDFIRCDSGALVVFDDRMPTKRTPQESWLQDPTTLTDFVRTGMKRYITHKHTQGKSILVVYVLEPEIEKLLESHQAQEKELPESECNRILAAISKQVGTLPSNSQLPALLTTIEVRSSLRRLVQSRFPYLSVLCYQELSPDVSIQPFARIAL
jgi:type III secretion protein V